MSATRTVTVDVTAEDIAAGKRGRCQDCPVALALARTLGTSVAMLYHWIFLSTERAPTLRVSTPNDVGDFMAHFDSGDPVAPFTFTIELPVEVLP